MPYLISPSLLLRRLVTGTASSTNKKKKEGRRGEESYCILPQATGCFFELATYGRHFYSRWQSSWRSCACGEEGKGKGRGGGGKYKPHDIVSEGDTRSTLGVSSRHCSRFRSKKREGKEEGERSESPVDPRQQSDQPLLSLLLILPVLEAAERRKKKKGGKRGGGLCS